MMEDDIVILVVTRKNPDAIFDPIITTLEKYYQEPVTKPPIDNDSDKTGKPADHLVVLMIPLSNQHEIKQRLYKTINYRPLPQSGIQLMGLWILRQDWTYCISMIKLI